MSRELEKVNRRRFRLDQSLAFLHGAFSGKEPNDVVKHAASEAYRVLVPVIRSAFNPIKKALLKGTLSERHAKLWSVVCYRLGNGYGFPEAQNWHEWDTLMGFDPHHERGIFNDFKSRIIQAIQSRLLFN